MTSLIVSVLLEFLVIVARWSIYRICPEYFSNPACKYDVPLTLVPDAMLVPDVVISSCELVESIGSNINATVAYRATDETAISESVI
tara:strand:+ start:432 stop:692 length:261 start_codon:yes stop_codon:yes gene_type:complete